MRGVGVDGALIQRLCLVVLLPHLRQEQRQVAQVVGVEGVALQRASVVLLCQLRWHG